MQLRHFVRENIPHFETKEKGHALLELFSISPNRKKNSSLISQPFLTKSLSWYDLLREHGKEKWAVNSRQRLIQFKVIHRFHYSKFILHKFYPSVSPTFDKCKVNNGTLLHLFSDCPVICTFWSKIFFLFSKPFQRSFLLDRNLAFFGFIVDSLALPFYIQFVLLMGTVLAKKLILAEWKTTNPPPFQNWLHELISVIHMEKLWYSGQSNQSKWDDSWGPVINYLDCNGQ